MLSACHERVQRSLDLLGRVVTHIDTKGHDDASRSAAKDVLRYFRLAAPLHHQDEELHLFPALLAHGNPALMASVQRLQHEHIEMERLWRAVEPVLVRWSEPDASQPTALEREAIGAFRSIYPAHIALEEESVFPAAFALLGPEGSQRAGAEMQERRKVGHNQPGAPASAA